MIAQVREGEPPGVTNLRNAVLQRDIEGAAPAGGAVKEVADRGAPRAGLGTCQVCGWHEWDGEFAVTIGHPRARQGEALASGRNQGHGKVLGRTEVFPAEHESLVLIPRSWCHRHLLGENCSRGQRHHDDSGPKRPPNSRNQGTPPCGELDACTRRLAHHTRRLTSLGPSAVTGSSRAPGGDYNEARAVTSPC